VIDAPGPWGTGPFTLVEGYSSINTILAIQRVSPQFVAASLITGEDRTDRVVLAANRDHNTERKARVASVVFRNDLTPREALEAVCDREGEIDIVTEVSPVDAERVAASAHARLVATDANRVLVGLFNTWPENDVALSDRRLREALNWAVDRHAIVAEAFGGYATALASMTPPWCRGIFPGAEPRRRDVQLARELLASAQRPRRPLRIASPAAFAAIAEMVARDVREALELEADVLIVPGEQLVSGARQLVEKKLPPSWDVLLHAWFDLSSDLPPAVVHREFFGSDGAFRAGPEDAQFDRLFSELAHEVDPQTQQRLAEQIDQYCYEQANALFLCAPQALYAVNEHVHFQPYRATFELADTEVDEGHWSR
jgi:peptide/nickel transport system substrate-binding protein